MYIIAGLGNPGKQYEHTRHNVGFDTLDKLAEKYHISIDNQKHKAVCGSGYIEGQKVILVKPQTYMNLSGESLREIIDFYKLDPAEEEIRKNWAIDRTFVPEITAEERERKLKGWNKAVKYALHWAKDEE